MESKQVQGERKCWLRTLLKVVGPMHLRHAGVRGVAAGKSPSLNPGLVGFVPPVEIREFRTYLLLVDGFLKFIVPCLGRESVQG